MRRRAAIAALGAAATSGATAFAAPDPLLGAARREGGPSVYSAMAADDSAALAHLFELTHDFPVRILRLESDRLPAKIAVEARAGAPAADVSYVKGYQTDQLKRAGLLERYVPPEAGDLVAASADPDGYWTTGSINTDVATYNRERVAKLGLPPPRSWADFAHPAWHGHFALYQASYEWFAVMKRVLGAAPAERLFRALASNKPVLAASHQLPLNLTAAGEYAGTINVYGYDVLRLKRAGAPLELVTAAPTIAELNALAVVKNAPHPASARLFIRWFLSRATQRWARTALGRISPRKDVANDPEVWNPNLRITISNPAASANYADEVRAFNEIFGIAG